MVGYHHNTGARLSQLPQNYAQLMLGEKIEREKAEGEGIVPVAKKSTL